MDLEDKRKRLEELKSQRQDLKEHLELEVALDEERKLLEREKKRLADLKFKNSFLGRLVK